jgi:hypothetical protein
MIPDRSTDSIRSVAARPAPDLKASEARLRAAIDPGPARVTWAAVPWGSHSGGEYFAWQDGDEAGFARVAGSLRRRLASGVDLAGPLVCEIECESIKLMTGEMAVRGLLKFRPREQGP